MGLVHVLKFSLNGICIGIIRTIPMFEHHQAPLLPRTAFFVRLAKSAGAGFLIIAVSLGIGITGYHHFESMSWVDAFVNASMILSGMGPMTPLKTGSGKLFAGCYALFSGLALITILALVFAPVIHRFLHKFHLESDSDDEEDKSGNSKETR